MRRLSPTVLVAIAAVLTALLVVFVLAGDKKASNGPPRDRLTDRQAGAAAPSEAQPPVDPWATLPGNEGETAMAPDYPSEDGEIAPSPPPPPPPPLAQAPATPGSRPTERIAVAEQGAPRPVAGSQTTAARPRPQSGAARPSFHCRNARTRSEIAVCGNAGLASLDRQMAGQFNQAMARATPAQRQQLLRSRGAFLRSRDACGSAACIAQTYRERTREIGAIVRSSPQASVNVPAPAVGAPPVAANATAARPSFNCRYALTNSEKAVCREPGLANLDRQMAAEFNSVLRQGTPAQRELLQRTRSRFLAYRDRCKSTACIAAAYRARLTEINDIAAGRWKVP